MSVRSTPHKQPYLQFLDTELVDLLLEALDGCVLPMGSLRVANARVLEPIQSERRARDLQTNWRGWLTFELGFESTSASKSVAPVSIPVPWMTSGGTFIRQGTDLAPLVQLLPRPGAWLSSSLNDAGTKRTARIDIIPVRGSRIRLVRSRGLDDSHQDAAGGNTRVVWVTSYLRNPPGTISALRAALATGGQWIPTLGAEGRERLNAFVNAHLVTHHDVSAATLVAEDLDALFRCLEIGLEDPDPSQTPTGPDPADLRELRALTIADQMREAFRSALGIAVERLGMLAESADGVPVTGNGPEPSTPAASPAGLAARVVSRFGRAAFAFGPARNGIVRELGSQTRLRAPLADGRVVQPLDQTNPLAEYSHLHKVTRGGPGAVNAAYGAAEYRELHDSQFGALCPFETPESEHIGLRLHLARAHEIVDGRLQARGGVDRLDEDAWLGGAASLIPFLCHNDAARGLMGAKNLKQAVPLCEPELPLVRTGWEEELAEAIGAVVVSKAAGTVSAVDDRSGFLKVRRPGARGGVVDDTYVCESLRPTAAGTVAGLQPLVEVGQEVGAGDVLMAHPAVRDGSLALGVNVRVAYLPFWGLNSEDGIVVSDRLNREGVFASRHILRLRLKVPVDHAILRGRAEPGGEMRPARLDDNGIVRVGTWVDVGDEVARFYGADVDAKQVVLRRYARAGEYGTVTRNRLRRMAGGRQEVELWLESVRHLEAGDKLMGRHGNKGVVTAVVREEDMPWIDGIGPVDLVLSPVGVLNRMNLGQLAETHVGWCLRHPKDEAQPKPPQVFTPSTRLEAADLARWIANSQQVDGSGRVHVRLGKNGALTEQPVVVGYQYFVKLNHLAQNKVVFRGVGSKDSPGSYGRATLQPVRGRRVRGGQRLGEMEAWALAAWGVPTLLDEFRGLKADDVERRAGYIAAVTDGDLPLAESLGKAHVSEAWFRFQTLAIALGFNFGLVTNVARDVSQAPPPADNDRSTASSGRPKRPPANVLCALLPGLSHPLVEDVSDIWCQVLDDEALLDVVAERRAVTGPLAKVLLPMADQPVISSPSVRRRRDVWLTLDCGKDAKGNPLSCEGIADWILDRKQQKGGWKCKAHGAPYSPERVPRKRADVFGEPRGLYAPEVWGGLDGDIRAQLVYGVIDLGEDSGALQPITGKSLRYVPVLPPAFRRADDALDNAYQQVIRASVPFCAAKGRVFDVTALKLKLDALYDQLLALVGTKAGFLRQRLLGKRVDLSGRAVVVGDPSLGADECGIPLDAGVGICESALRKDLAGWLRTLRLDGLQLSNQLLQASQGFTTALELQAWIEIRGLDPAQVFKALGAKPGQALDVLRGCAGVPTAGLIKACGRHPHYPTLAGLLLEHGRSSGGGRTVDEWLSCRGFDPGRLPTGDRPTAKTALALMLQEECQALLDARELTVLLNRQPTLHRYGLMAFRPIVRVDGVIGLSPAVCAAFNADFDGDTMALHVPASVEASRQAWTTMRPSVNLRSSAAGRFVLEAPHEARAGMFTFGSREHTHGMSEDHSTAAETLERVRNGYDAATRAGLSPSFLDLAGDDLNLLAQALDQSATTTHADATLTAWAESRPSDPLAVFAASKALRRPTDSLVQLCYRRGRFAKLTGGETPSVESSLVRGLTPGELFLSCFGARKTLAEKKLLTPKAGELTRLLAWAAGELRVAEGDCGSTFRLNPDDLRRDGDVVLSAEVWAGQREHESGSVRTPLGCMLLKDGCICQACYGNTISGKPPKNTPVGMLAATSVGERGTQLALRTFHTGGVAGLDTMTGFPRVRALLLGQKVLVRGTPGDNEWTRLVSSDAGESTGFDGSGSVALSLDDAAEWGLANAVRVFLFEMFSNYSPDEIDARHFEVVFASLMRLEEDGTTLTIRSLLETALAQRSPLDAVAFGYARRTLTKLGTGTYSLSPPTRARLLGGRR